MALTLVIASANPHKSSELRELLSTALGSSLILLDRPTGIAEVEETGSTLEENARLKARAISDATGLAAMADDTGLEVAALDGAPGVYSARYAGEHASYEDNVNKLLAELRGSTDRRARFRTVCLVRLPDGRELIAEGVAEGTIAEGPTGSEGFGYDPIFLPAANPAHSYGELAAAEKNLWSHRAAAIRALARDLRAFVADSDAS